MASDNLRERLEAAASRDEDGWLDLDIDDVLPEFAAWLRDKAAAYWQLGCDLDTTNVVRRLADEIDPPKTKILEE